MREHNWETLQKIINTLYKYGVIVHVLPCDGDPFTIKLKNDVFDTIYRKFGEGNQDVFDMISSNPIDLIMPDALHLLKLSGYLIRSLRITYSYRLEEWYWGPVDLQNLLPELPLDCWDTDKRKKMRDDIALQTFCK